MNKPELNLEDIFTQCYRPKDYTEPTRLEFKLDEAQRKEIAQFVWRMDGVAGVTLDGVRYLTNSKGALLINSFAIVQMDAWQVFRQLFEALGDAWRIGQFGGNAEKITVETPESPLIKQSIESWSEDLEEMDLLAITSEHVGILKNSSGQGVFVNLEPFSGKGKENLKPSQPGAYS